ncbi:MAG: hypothetical protein JRC60_04420, partial [Deltaproteobacteria bacterium]|nr:hypothetical protein [Deltaproteobacteria bacterium]
LLEGAAPGTHIKIDSNNNIIHTTPANRQAEIGGDKSENINGNKLVSVGGDVTDDVAGNWTIQAADMAIVEAPHIILEGDLMVKGPGIGGTSGITFIGDLNVEGNISATGTIIDTDGNTNHHSH